MNHFVTFLFLSGFISEVAKLGTQGAPVCRVFTLEELKEATNNFDSSSFMGEGSIGKVPHENSSILRKFSRETYFEFLQP